MEDELTVLRSIVKRAQSPMWWARLSYPDDPKFWTPAESAALHAAYSGQLDTT